MLEVMNMVVASGNDNGDHYGSTLLSGGDVDGCVDGGGDGGTDCEGEKNGDDDG